MFCENVGFEESHLTYAKYKEYMHKFKINNFEETEGIIEKQRMIKDDEEISNTNDTSTYQSITPAKMSCQYRNGNKSNSLT